MARECFENRKNRCSKIGKINVCINKKKKMMTDKKMVRCEYMIKNDIKLAVVNEKYVKDRVEWEKKS